MIQPCLNNFKIRYLLIIILQFYLVLNRVLLVLPFWIIKNDKIFKSNQHCWSGKHNRCDPVPIRIHIQ